jgi:fructosamine-3-kinase
MQFSPNFHQHLQEKFSQFFQTDVQINNISPAHGGDINQCFILDTTAGQYFIKINAALFGRDFFEKEARGLMALLETGTLKTPQPLFDGKFHQEIYLVMEYLLPGVKGPAFWPSFAKGLALLHKKSNTEFGWYESNFIGRLVQQNNFTADWISFYIDNRLLCNFQTATDKHLLDNSDLQAAEKLCARLPGLMPSEPPSLLHGDLWSGNFMSLADGRAAIFDPAVYYGHRETDIAMTYLFGGFNDAFYDTYNAEFPLEAGWQERLPLFQLYPLLIHLLLFGGHYRESVKNILKKFS